VTVLEAVIDWPPLVISFSVTLGMAVGVTERVGVMVTVGVGVRVLSSSISLAGTPRLSTGF